jgi:MFS family permease
VLIPIVLSGLSYALVAGTAWNGTFYLIERPQMGTATGLAAALLSLMFVLLPLQFGWLVDHSKERQQGYYDPIVMQLMISVLSVVINLINFWYDRYFNESVLALDVPERNKLFESRKHRN